MKKNGFTHDSVDNLSVDWYTPPHIFDGLGVFDLDPASPIGGVKWIPALQYYTLEDDGLTSDWYGRVWLNPPYGKHTPQWLAKMHTHRNGIALLFSRTDCAWFHDYVAKADAILFLKGRVKFVDGLGVSGGNGAGSGSMLIAWGDENVKALAGIQNKGYLVVNNYCTGEKLMREFEVEDWASSLSKEVAEHLQQAILMGAKYKELYEKLLYEKNILISCLCSGKMDVIGVDDEEGQTTYHVRVAPLDNDNENTEEAVWGLENGETIEGYSCYSPYSAVQWMLTEMKKWEETK